MMSLHSASDLVLLVSVSCNSSGQLTYPHVFQVDFCLTDPVANLGNHAELYEGIYPRGLRTVSSPNLVLARRLLVDAWIYRFIIAVGEERSVLGLTPAYPKMCSSIFAASSTPFSSFKTKFSSLLRHLQN